MRSHYSSLNRFGGEGVQAADDETKRMADNLNASIVSYHESIPGGTKKTVSSKELIRERARRD